MVLENVLVPLKVLLFARRVELAAVTVMLPVPSKDVPFMVRAFCNAVAVEALPVNAPVMPPENVMLVEVALEGKG